MAKKTQPTQKLENTEVKVSYYANGDLYAVTVKDDTVRFYRLEDDNGTPTWTPTDIYLKGPVAVAGIEQ